MASWDSIGTVEVGNGQNRDRAYTQFAGGVDRLQFVAENGDVSCRYIRALYTNGRTQTIFQGNMNRGEARTIQLPGDSAHVRSLDFNCAGNARGQVRIDIRAEITTPRYRDEWRRSPSWSRWSQVFHWGPAPAGPSISDTWRTIGVQRFGYANERSGSIAGFGGRSVAVIGLRSDADARCPRIWVQFANGQKVDFANGSQLLLAGRLVRFDLPGNNRNVNRVNLTCRAVKDRDVTIQILAAG